MDDGARRKLAEIDSRPEFRVEIDLDGGWYGFGTTFVAIWRGDL